MECFFVEMKVASNWLSKCQGFILNDYSSIQKDKLDLIELKYEYVNGG